VTRLLLPTPLICHAFEDALGAAVMPQSAPLILSLVCGRLSRIERKEATLLYADVMNTRAKLVHAQDWLGEH
jgi:hypothetical protein